MVIPMIHSTDPFSELALLTASILMIGQASRLQGQVSGLEL